MAEWFESLSDDLKGHVSANGWQELPADQAIPTLLNAHLAALKTAPSLPSNAVVIPKDSSDTEGWAKLNAALGVPKDATAYQFEGVDDAQKARFQALAAKLQLTPEKAVTLAQDLLDADKSAAATTLAQKSATRNEQIAALRQAWGGNYDQNKVAADRAAQVLGLDPQTFEAVASAVGYDKLMGRLHQLAVRTGEAPFHQGEHNKPATLQTAQERKDDLMRDEGWVAKYLKGDREALAEMAALNQAIVAARMAR